MLVTNCGGRGAAFRNKGTPRKLKFSNGSGNGKPSKKLFPSQINRIGSTGNEDKMVDLFEKENAWRSNERAIQVDENGL